MAIHFRTTRVQRTVEQVCESQEKSIRYERFKGFRSSSTQGQKNKTDRSIYNQIEDA